MCNCGGSSNVYKPATTTANTQTTKTAPAVGLPKVYNGPRAR